MSYKLKISNMLRLYIPRQPEFYGQLILGAIGLVFTFKANEILTQQTAILQSQDASNKLQAELAANQNKLLLYEKRPRIVLESAPGVNPFSPDARDIVIVRNDGDFAKNVKFDWHPVISVTCRDISRGSLVDSFYIPTLYYSGAPLIERNMNKSNSFTILDRSAVGSRGDSLAWDNTLKSLDFGKNEISSSYIQTRVKIVYEDLFGTKFRDYYTITGGEENINIMSNKEERGEEFEEEYSKLFTGDGNDGAGVNILDASTAKRYDIPNIWGKSCLSKN